MNNKNDSKIKQQSKSEQHRRELVIVDEQTQRLLDLTEDTAMKNETEETSKHGTRQQIFKRSDDDIEQIITLVNDKAPKLLDGLSEKNKRKIASTLYLKTYERDAVIFSQNDFPDAYYTVIRGAVSIYALNSSTTNASNNNNTAEGNTSNSSNSSSASSATDGTTSTPTPSSSGIVVYSNRKQYGKFIAQLAPGESFGELSFNEDYKHSKRNAGVISDGNHGQTRIPLVLSPSSAVAVSNSSSCSEPKGVSSGAGAERELETSDVAILLLIPEKTYMTEMFGLHATRHQMKDKIAYLKTSPLFEHWSFDQQVQMAYSMKKVTYEKGSVIAQEGDRVDQVWIIKKGRVLVSTHMSNSAVTAATKKAGTKMTASKKNSEGNSNSNTHTKIEIADLTSGDMFGLVEVITGTKKMKRTFLAAASPQSKSKAQSQTSPTSSSPSSSSSSLIELFIISSTKFSSFLRQDPKINSMLEGIVQNRISWENWRKQFSMKFPTMPKSLPKKADEMSKYSITRFMGASSSSSTVANNCRDKKMKEKEKARVRIQS